MVTVHDVIIREFHKVLMEGEKGSLAQGFPVGGGRHSCSCSEDPNAQPRYQGNEHAFQKPTRNWHSALMDTQALQRLSDTVSDLSRDSERRPRSRSLSIEDNIQQDVKCEMKVKPGGCLRKEFLSAIVKIKF